VLKVSLRRDDRIAVAVNGSEDMPASISARAPLEITVRWDDKHLHVLAGGPAMGDLAEEIATLGRSDFPGQPKLVRLGKMPNSGAAVDHGDAGPVGFSRLEWFRVHAK
jgi:hypothetical protein